MGNTRTITPNDPADFTPEMGNYKTLQPFRYWCQKVLPLVYDDSLSYYELLCKVVDYLNKTMEDVETLHGDVTNLHNAYVQLQTYVNNYFSTLDVQEEINNKLDDMVKDGSLSQIMHALVVPLEERVNVLTQRVNTFQTLPSGSTVLDAEIIDGRIQVNGVKGGTIGEAIRGQVKNLSERFNFELTGREVFHAIKGKEISFNVNVNSNIVALSFSSVCLTDTNKIYIETTTKSGAKSEGNIVYLPNLIIFNSPNEEYVNIKCYVFPNDVVNTGEFMMNIYKKIEAKKIVFNDTFTGSGALSAYIPINLNRNETLQDINIKINKENSDNGNVFCGAYGANGKFYNAIVENQKINEWFKLLLNREIIGLEFYITGLEKGEYSIEIQSSDLEFADDKIGIIGDSYSSFSNWNGDYPAYYPSSQGLSVEQMWYHRLSKSTGVNIEYISAETGSSICNTGYNDNINSFMKRMRKDFNNFNHPCDTIFIEGGLNDWWSNSPTGSMDNIYPVWSNEDLKQVYPALCYLLFYLHQQKPNVKLIFLFMDIGVISDEWKENFRTICKLYNCKFVECKIDSSYLVANHPNARGQMFIAGYANKALMDN